MKFEPEVQVTALVVAGIVMCCGFVATCVGKHAEVDAKAPIVETCVKHPATSSPFRSSQ